MNGIGDKLRQAREAKGYTIVQLAERIRLMSQVVEGLENEDYSRIPAPIYGRGFVKLYAEAVGLDPMQCVNEFMASFNGEDSARPVAPVAPPPTPSFAVNDAPAAPVAVERPAPVAEERPAPAVRDAGLSRYATPIRDSATLRERLALIPPQFWRFALLAIAALAIIAALVFGIRAVYRATSTSPESVAAAPKTAPKAASATAPAKTDAVAKERKVSLPPEIYFN